MYIILQSRQRQISVALSETCLIDILLTEVVKTTILEQNLPNHKIDGGLCLQPPSSNSKDGVFIAQPPIYPAAKNDVEIQISLFLFI